MDIRRRTWAWAIWLVAGIVGALLGVLFLVLELDDADKVGSVIGALSAVTGVAVSGYALATRPGDAPEGTAAPTSGQRIHGTVIGGDGIQVRNVGGDVRIGRSAGNAVPGERRESGAGDGESAAQDGQAMSGSSVGGSVVQVDGVRGGVDIDA